MEKNYLDLQLFAYTAVSDLVIPEIYTAYMNENSTVKSELLKSGIALTNAKMQELASGAGVTINVPFLKPLSGDSEVLIEGTASVPAKMSASKQVGIRLIRIKSWEWTDLGQILSQADPIMAFYSQVSDFWKREEQKVVIAEINGLFNTGGALVSTHLNDISAVSLGGAITADAILDTKQKLGDNASQLTNIAMRSETYTKLQKDNLIETIVDSEGKVVITRYMTYDVTVDDSLPVTDGVYTTVLYGKGSFGYGAGNPNGLIPIEADRDSLSSADIIITRRSFVIHPQGLKWTGTTMVNETPSNAELSTVANWTKVMEDKNIHMVALKHKLVNNVA